jgi:hypothetical protein
MLDTTPAHSQMPKEKAVTAQFVAPTFAKT